MHFVVDIDDTLIKSDAISCDSCGRIQYQIKEIFQEEVRYVNILFDKGHRIILWTGRNWDCYDLTKQQLEQAGVKYHELVMGKPQGRYIDRDARTSLKEFIDE